MLENNYTYIVLFVIADGDDGECSSHRLSPLLQRNDFLGPSDQGLDLVPEGVEFVFESLHALEEFLTDVQAEVTLTELGIHNVVFPKQPK